MRYFLAGGLYCIGVLILVDLVRTLNRIRNERRAAAKQHVPYKLS
jgi:hypothetical protein